jgi:hypothetical protein
MHCGWLAVDAEDIGAENGNGNLSACLSHKEKLEKVRGEWIAS